MGVEIERRFLVASSQWKATASQPKRLMQAYIAITPAASVRVRVIDEAKAFVTIKSAKAELSRTEYEYAIPVDDAHGLIEMRTGRLIAKRRYEVIVKDLRWEIDVFEGTLNGLVIAEAELDNEDHEIQHPAWLGDEITSDVRYANSSLALNGRP